MNLKKPYSPFLLEAQAAGEGPIQPEVIRKRLGIPKLENPTASTNSLIIGVLDHLKTEGLVQSETSVGWELSETAATLLDES